MKKNYIYIIVAVVVIGGALFWMIRNNKTDNIADISVSVSPSPSSIQSPVSTPKLTKNTPTPTPGLVFTEQKGYQYWVDLLEPLGRRLLLDKNYTSIVPSQVAYPNNTQIMLDNTLSAESRVLKIGDKDYSLKAREWSFVTLSSPTLPTKLTMFCGPMELGQLDLQ